MKWIFTSAVLLILCSLTVSFTDKEAVCHKYRNGKYLMRFRLDNSKEIAFICTRNGNWQTEENRDTHARSTLKIKWVRECTYEIRFVSTTQKVSAEDLALRKKALHTVQITGGTDRYYLYTHTSSLHKNSRSDTAWIIK
ncbi:hypothetical protein HNQ91_004566 [Filimonas zeae]|uniref:hypothetical protein n=1 Tax=Filimonas zeae TaxID=1737353 RepID=UPI00166EC037|nr:hypothetical protein [Filimonas zeae]MDR6341493.1 hypothetical protein [Filimonas zeae]